MRLLERGFKESLSRPEGSGVAGRAILEILGTISKITCINARVIYWIAAVLETIITNACSAQHPEDGRAHPAEGPRASVQVRLSRRPHLQMQTVLFTLSALKPKLMYANVLDLEMQALHMLGKSSTTQVYAPQTQGY